MNKYMPLSYASEDESEISKLTEKKKNKRQQTSFSEQWPKTPITAQIVGKKVIVFNHEAGFELYGHGRFFGIPVGIRKPKIEPFERPLELSYFEAFYLLDRNKIQVYNLSEEKLFTRDQFLEFAKLNYPFFEEKYVIYEDLREKRYIPRPGQKFGGDFIVYKKGPGLDHSSFCIQVLSRRAKISSIDVVRSARLATSVKKRFILANPLTKRYFSFKWYKP